MVCKILEQLNVVGKVLVQLDAEGKVLVQLDVVGKLLVQLDVVGRVLEQLDVVGKVSVQLDVVGKVLVLCARLPGTAINQSHPNERVWVSVQSFLLGHRENGRLPAVWPISGKSFSLSHSPLNCKIEYLLFALKN